MLGEVVTIFPSDLGLRFLRILPLWIFGSSPKGVNRWKASCFGTAEPVSPGGGSGKQRFLGIVFRDGVATVRADSGQPPVHERAYRRGMVRAVAAIR